MLGLVIGYAIRSQRSRVRISLSTHIEQSWSDRRIHVSIKNHGNTSVVVDSWTVHVPPEELLPGLPKEDKKPELGRDKRMTGLRRVAGRIRYRLFKGNRIEMHNELSETLAETILGKFHWRHELLDPGSTIRIGPGESAVRNFPRGSTVSSMKPIDSKAKHLTIIPSCHVVGHRRRIWGWSSFLGGASVPFAVQINPPRGDGEG